MNIRFLTTTAVLALLSACAATPAPPAPPAPAATMVVASASSAPAVPATAASAGQDEHTKYLAKKAGEFDYRVETRKGQLFYCQTSAQLGTRFQTKKCLNQADFEDVVRHSQEVQDIMRQQPACGGAACIHN